MTDADVRILPALPGVVSIPTIRSPRALPHPADRLGLQCYDKTYRDSQHVPDIVNLIRVVEGFLSSPTRPGE